MRLLNPGYPGGPLEVPSELVQDPNDPTRYEWTYATVDVSPGADRVEETSIDFNSPIAPDTPTCITTTEVNPPEGSTLCGGDPGEPNYAGFSGFNAQGYSTPAIRNVTSPGTPISGIGTGNHRLFDPTGCAERNALSNGSCVAGGFIVRLLKPTLRPRPNEQPNYSLNSVANLAADPSILRDSNENDYIRGNTPAEKRAARDVAMALGKALFWDMQVGSDGVQSCGTCHFTAGADNRTKNQINPNHLGLDTTFQIHGGAAPNTYDLDETDFPFSNGGDTAAHNDVASSMGVVFRQFVDIPTPGSGAFGAPANGVSPLLPDLGNPVPDPIPGFQGLRRVEPRNTPTLFASDMNFDNFWDGRARHDFNGGSVFGASDPQSHVFVTANPTGGQLVQTRQIIRFASLASLATGPALSDFEMSFAGRNWPKIGKKLLQAGVTPLANQLVEPTDSVLGPYSNQGGSRCAALGRPTALNKPGLCVSYAELIQSAYYPQLWQNTNRHLDGAAAVCTGSDPSGFPTPAGCDPFDGYSLTLANGAASATNTNQFRQMEANFSLFFGLSVHLWGTILMPDNTPFDQFMEVNPDSFKSLGEANEPGLVWDMPSCGQNGNVQPCFTESGPFKRDPGLPLNLETGPSVTVGTRQANDPDPLLGFDVFYGFNLSGKNPEFRTTRCGECHAGNNTTDHTLVTSSQLSLPDFPAEFVTPGVELLIEAMGRDRIISGFLLEDELNGNAQDALERNVVDQSLTPNPVDGLSYPSGSSFIDNGLYNLGVTPIANDVSRGGPDPFGWPLSLGALMLKNLGGLDCIPGVPIGVAPCDGAAFDPDLGPGGGLFDETPQDQQINPGAEEEPANPLLPPYLAPFASNLTVGDAHPEVDEAGGAPGGMLNTLTESPILEGYLDTNGPFNPAGITAEVFNSAQPVAMGTWPNVNRMLFDGAFKAPQLRNVELTGPYFHNGGKLTLRQVVDFYMRGGDFPVTNAAHRDMLILNLMEDVQAFGGLTPAEKEERIVALVDFLLTFTDDRVRFEQGPFDHPEIFVPLDGTAPDNGALAGGVASGRQGFLNNLANGLFKHVLVVGSGGSPTAAQPFLGLTNERNNPNCDPTLGRISQYCP